MSTSLVSSRAKNNYRSRKASFRGFTIIELSLSIAFIAILSIAVTLIIINSISSYRRGITLNQLNTTGMDLVDDLRASVQGSSAGSVVEECVRIYETYDTSRNSCEEKGAKNFVAVSRRANVSVGGESIGSVPVFGAFCSGEYSYIWNSGYFFNSDYSVDGVGRATFSYRLAGSGAVQTINTPFKLLKIKDESRSVCISAVLGSTAGTSSPRYKLTDNSSSTSINSGSNVFDISSDRYSVIESEPIDILSTTSSGNMALYDLTSTAPASGAVSRKLFYSVSFVLGTVQGGINIRSQGGYCATPEGYNSSVENFDYCAINKFNFAAQTTGG